MRFLKWFLLSLLAVVLTLLAVLAWINPRGELVGHTFPPGSLDVRRDKQALFAAFTREAPVTGLVLGSSRSMTIPPAVLDSATGLRFFNFAVHEGTIEDALATWRWIAPNATNLRVVVVGLDPWSLHTYPRSRQLDRNWNLVSNIDPSEQGQFAHLRFTIRFIKETLTVSYLADAARSVSLKINPRVPIQILHTDGGMHYERWDGQRSAGTFDNREVIAACRQRFQEDASGQARISGHRVAMLDSLVREARAAGVNVVLWVTPDNPILADIVRTSTASGVLAALSDSLLSAYERDDHVAVLRPAPGSSLVPYADDWYDCSHFGKANSAAVAISLGRVISQGFQGAK